MSLTADIITYLTTQGHIDEINWKSSVGIEQMPARVEAAPQVIAVQDAAVGGDDTHGNDNRHQGIRVLVRGKQHAYETTRTKFLAVFDALQDKAEEITADPGTTETILHIHSDNEGPLVSFGGNRGDRIHMTTLFRMMIAKQ